MCALGVPKPPQGQKSAYNLQSVGPLHMQFGSSVSTVPHPRIQPITDSTSLGTYSTVVFTTEKNPHISGPVLSKGQLYIQCSQNGAWCLISTLFAFALI